MLSQQAALNIKTGNGYELPGRINFWRVYAIFEAFRLDLTARKCYNDCGIDFIVTHGGCSHGGV